MLLELNSLETARFGIIAARTRDSHATPEALNSAAMAQGVQMLTTRIDCTEHAKVHALEADGHRLMDSLVYYRRRLQALPAPRALPDGLDLRRANPEDAPAVAAIALEAFQGYLGHYHTDPRLDDAAADAAYVEWAETSIARTCDDAPVVLALLDGAIAGFLTLRRNSAEQLEIVLNAVTPAAQGRGVYGQMLSRALQIAKDMGGAEIIVSTQLDNFNVQRAWAAQGLRLYRCLHTFHKWYDPAP